MVRTACHPERQRRIQRGFPLPAPARNRLRGNDDDGDLHFPRGAAVIVSARWNPSRPSNGVDAAGGFAIAYIP